MVCDNKNIIIISPKLLIRGPVYGCDELRKDDWLFCDKGYNLEAFGFINPLVTTTKGSELELYKNNSTEIKDRIDRCVIVNNQISVVFEDDILNYNPYFKKWFMEHPNHAVRLENYNGTVNIIDNQIIGTGDINFKSYVG